MQKKEIKIMFWDMHNSHPALTRSVSLAFLPFPRMYVRGLCLRVKKNGISHTPLESLKQWRVFKDGIPCL